MRRLRYWLLRFRLAAARATAKLPPAPRRALRNLFMLWLGITLVFVAAAALRMRPDRGEAVAAVTSRHWHDAVDTARDAWPAVQAWLVEGWEWAGFALDLALPVLTAEETETPPRQAWPGWTMTVRRAVRALSGVDIADPAAVLGYGLPGFDAHLRRLGDTGLPTAARAMAPPGSRADRRETAASGAPAMSPPAGGSPPDPTVSAAGMPSASRSPGVADEAAPSQSPGADARSSVLPPSPTPADPPPAEALLERRPTVAWGDDCRVLIYHTHTSEMYRTDEFAPPSPEQYHVFNTTDTGVVRVGRAITERLGQLGIPACHLTDVHDWPSHPRAYMEARATVEQFLRRHPHVEMVLDVHRDAPPGLVTTVGGRRAAQIAFVLGTNARMHPAWPQNVAFARTLADLLEQRYPGLFRRIIERPDARLNQDLHPRAILVEIGSYDTYLHEAVLSAELFAEALADMMHVIRFGRPVMEPMSPR